MRISLIVLLVAFSMGAADPLDFLPVYARDTPEDAYLPAPPRVVTDAPSAAAVAEVEALLERFQRAWQAKDVEGVIDTYAPDAQWTNAFGLVLRGHQEMRQFFPELFRHFDPTSIENVQTVSIRFVNDEVAIVQRYLQSGGPSREGGEDLRLNQVTNVMQKFDDGWKTIHQMIMDVRL